MAEANHCSNCGAERPAAAPMRLCPGCLMRNARGGYTLVPADDAHDVGPAATAAGPPEAVANFPKVTAAHTPGQASTTADATLDLPAVPLGPNLTGDGRAAEAPLPRGATVRYVGDCLIHKESRRGGMGVVYEAQQASLNRPVALKMVRAGLLVGDVELRRLRNEADAVALLDHPGVVPACEVGERTGQHDFSMKLVTGAGLVPLLDRYEDDLKAAPRLSAEVIEAAAQAHLWAIQTGLGAVEMKQPKAGDRLVSDRAAFLILYNFPAENSRQVRTTNPIDSTFATVRLWHGNTRGTGSRADCLVMVFKLMEPESTTWQALNGSARHRDIISGTKFDHGVEKDAA